MFWGCICSPSWNSSLYSVMTINSWSSKHYGKACWSWKLHYNQELCPGTWYHYCHYCKSWNFKNNPLKENDLKEKLLLHINLFRCLPLPLNLSIFSKNYIWGNFQILSMTPAFQWLKPLVILSLQYYMRDSLLFKVILLRNNYIEPVLLCNHSS